LLSFRFHSILRLHSDTTNPKDKLYRIRWDEVVVDSAVLSLIPNVAAKPEGNIVTATDRAQDIRMIFSSPEADQAISDYLFKDPFWNNHFGAIVERYKNRQRRMERDTPDRVAPIRHQRLSKIGTNQFSTFVE
jgi:hypothetical protein